MTTAAKSSKGPDHATHTDSSAGSHGVALAPPAYGIDMVDSAPIGEEPLQLMPKVGQMRGPGLLGAKGRAISASAPSSPPNNNGLSDHLKAGIESPSRFDMSVVQRKHASTKAGLTGESADRQEDKWLGANDPIPSPHVNTLTHVVQQTRAVHRKSGIQPGNQNPVQDLTPVKPSSSAIHNVISFFKKLPPTDIKQYYIVNINTLTIYDKDGKAKEIFKVNRPGVVDVTGYYIGSPFFNVGWGWISKTAKDKLEVMGLSQMGMQEAKRQTEKGKLLQAVDAELFIIDWIKDADVARFWESTDRGLIAMAVVNTPLKNYSSDQKEGPVLSYDYPAWFKELKTKIENRIGEERKSNKDNPNIPDKLFFYGSDKVQAQRGADAWTIEVEKGKREAYLTVAKKAWVEATDKDAYAQQVTEELYKKVKLIVDESELQKQEQKEITEIDRTGAKKKDSKWAWAVALKKQLEALLNEQKKRDTAAKDFPDNLTLATQGDADKALAYLRVWVYDSKDPKPDALPKLIGGTLPAPLKEGDKAENWGPIVRKAAEALRRGRTTTEKSEEGGKATVDSTVLPPYPAKIHPSDLNPDRTTATFSSNSFRMVVDTAAVHGTNLLNLTTIHMGMSIGYSWKVYPLPKELKVLKGASEIGSSDEFLKQSNEYAQKNSASLGIEKETYEPDYDWDQSVTMSKLGEGEFLMFSRASIAYPPDWNMKRQPSVAGLPFTVMKPEDLAGQSAYADSDALKKLKAQLANEKDEKKKQFLLDQIKDLEEREGSDLLRQTRKDAAETQRLIKKAGELKKFIEDDRKRKLSFSGGKDYNPFMFRLKAFDKDLYTLYILVRQVFDYRYGDIYAIDEYTKLMQQQYNELHNLEKRTLRLTDNEKLRQDLPSYRSVAALVKEDDGNLVPLILLVGHHKDSKPNENKYRMMVLDLTFDSKKGDMTYVGGEKTAEEDAVKSAFVEFGEDNQYGTGKVVYRVPKKGYKNQVDSITTATEYLGYALAVIGIVLLVAGTILSGGAAAPGAGAAIGAIVTALGISAGVAGAVLSGRNIYKRVEKGTFELDAEFALDVIAIIGAAVQVASTAGKLTTLTRAAGTAQRAVQIQRLEKLLVIYNTVELGGNIVLVGLKVSEDVEAVKALHLPPEQEDEMMQQIAMEAVQQGAMLAFASVSHAKEISDHIKAKVEASRYKSFQERGWTDERGKPTELAPPFMRERIVEPGKATGRAAQAEQAWKETHVLDLAAKPTADGEHKLTITENGRIIRCSDFCTDLRLKYGETLGQDPWMNKEMGELEARAQQVAKSGNKAEADKVAADASTFESKLKQVDDLRTHLFGMTDEEIEAAMESIDTGRVTGGQKSGYKINGVPIPKRQRRLNDVVDIMTEAEEKDLGKGGFRRALDRISKVMGKKISDIAELKDHWDTARTDVLKGKQVTDYSREEVLKMYKDARARFWENVRSDTAAVDFLNKHGFEFEGDSGAAMATLGPQGKATNASGNITNQERRVSLDHIKEKAQGDNWKISLDADNLELMFQNANSWKEIVQVKFGMRQTVP